MTTLSVLLLCAIPIAGMAQHPVRFHAESVSSPRSMAGSAAYAGILQEVGAPEEWGQGAGAYGSVSPLQSAAPGIHACSGFWLGSTLRRDPRYSRSRRTGFWRRAVDAFRGTILTRADRGGETLSNWRLGSAYGATLFRTCGARTGSISPAISAPSDSPGLLTLWVMCRVESQGREAEVLALMHRYDWPGNVRELRNILERATIMSGEGWIRLPHLPSPTFGKSPGPYTRPSPDYSLRTLQNRIAELREVADSAAPG